MKSMEKGYQPSDGELSDSSTIFSRLGGKQGTDAAAKSAVEIYNVSDSENSEASILEMTKKRRRSDSRSKSPESRRRHKSSSARHSSSTKITDYRRVSPSGHRRSRHHSEKVSRKRTNRSRSRSVGRGQSRSPIRYYDLSEYNSRDRSSSVSSARSRSRSPSRSPQRKVSKDYRLERPRMQRKSIQPTSWTIALVKSDMCKAKAKEAEAIQTSAGKVTGFETKRRLENPVDEEVPMRDSVMKIKKMKRCTEVVSNGKSGYKPSILPPAAQAFAELPDPADSISSDSYKQKRLNDLKVSIVQSLNSRAAAKVKEKESNLKSGKQVMSVNFNSTKPFNASDHVTKQKSLSVTVSNGEEPYSPSPPPDTATLQSENTDNSADYSLNFEELNVDDMLVLSELPETEVSPVRDTQTESSSRIATHHINQQDKERREQERQQQESKTMRKLLNEIGKVCFICIAM